MTDSSLVVLQFFKDLNDTALLLTNAFKDRSSWIFTPYCMTGMSSSSNDKKQNEIILK